MLVLITQTQPSAAVSLTLPQLTTSDVVVCKGNGVYQFNQISQVTSASTKAMFNDSQRRGLVIANAHCISDSELVSLQQQHQHWITL